MKSILVTGGAGFIGSHIVDALIESGTHKVFVIDNLSNGFKKNIHPKADFFKRDIRDPGLKKVFLKIKPEFLIHCAAQIDVRFSVADPIEDISVNLIGSVNLFEWARISGVRKIITLSTGGAIYPESSMPADDQVREIPLSPYGIDKLAMDRYLSYYHEIFGMDFCSLRLSNVYGPRQNAHGESGVMAIFINKFLNGEIPTQNGSGKQTRDYIYVKDVVDCVLKALQSSRSGVYNVGTGVETSLLKLIKIIKKVGGFNSSVEKIPAKPGEVMRSCLDSSRTVKHLRWTSRYSIEEGVKETISWFSSLK